MEEQKKRLLEVLREKSLKIGNFTLVSGMKSHYYFDSKPTTLDPEGGYLTARMILQLLKEKGIEAESIGGLTLGADPIVSAVAAVSFAEKDEFTPLPAYIVRKDGSFFPAEVAVNQIRMDSDHSIDNLSISQLFKLAFIISSISSI